MNGKEKKYDHQKKCEKSSEKNNIGVSKFQGKGQEIC